MNDHGAGGFKAIIFDMDGLVLDTERTYFAAWQTAAAKMNFPLGDDFCLSLSGLDYINVVGRIESHCGDGFDKAIFDRLGAECWREHVAVHGIAVKKGFYKLLRCIETRRLPYCLATNSFTRSARECLRYAGLETAFPLLVGRDAVARGKPEPDIFIRAAELLGMPPADCLIVEDSPAGVLAATRTGAKVVFIPSLQPADPGSVERADFVFDDLGRLADFVIQGGLDPV